MKRISILVFFLIISFSCHVCASTWQNIYKSADSSLYIDIDSIRFSYDQKTGFDINNILYWSKTHYNHSPITGEAGGDMICYQSINVPSRTCALLAYYAHFADGDDSEVKNATGKYLSVDLDQESLTEYNFICNYSQDHKDEIKNNENKSICISR